MSFYTSHPVDSRYLGYELDSGRRVRYDSQRHVIAISKSGRLTTACKPEEGINYYVDQVRKDANKE